ncbi:MAG: prolipoprotein diacylglyceryl transferase [Ignavibacteriaceae bacterium]|nr:prolipoprotein diacylglyceryl transferase [Ignavibacteriaceae bacterium]
MVYPELFNIGPFTVHSYGLMLGIAFIVASWILTRELRRKNLDPNFSTEITLLAIIFGIAGSKIAHLIANPSEFAADPVGSLFSPGGLTFHGGLILATIAIYIFVKRKGIPFLFIADSAAPSLAIAYGIGRIGCHLSGDGDYGLPTNLPWGVNYENGIVQPSLMFAGSDIARAFPNGIVPDNTPLHPTPIYEFLLMGIIFLILWKLRTKAMPDGFLFSLYLLLAGFERLMIEFIRLNPKLLFGLSEAQLVATGLIIAGGYGVFYFSKNKDLPKYSPPQHLQPKVEPKKSKNK